MAEPVWICTTWKIDWAAVGAVMTGFGALGAAWAAWAAKRAADVALQIDMRNRADRMLRRKEQALAMSVAIRVELKKLAGVGERLGDMPVVNRGVGKQAIEYAMAGLTLVSAPMIDRFSANFSSFDVETAAHLNLVLAAIAQLNQRPPLLEKLSDEGATDMVNSIRDSGRTLRRISIVARRRLSKYSRGIVHKSPPPGSAAPRP